jgi:hypothetical protein
MDIANDQGSDCLFERAADYAVEAAGYQFQVAAYLPPQFLLPVVRTGIPAYRLQLGRYNGNH